MAQALQTLVLVFAHSAAEEAAHKGWQHQGLAAHGSQQLARGLLQHTLRQVKASGLPWQWLSTPQQQGHTFGQRLANAIERAWQQGYQQCIVVGSDCPTLQAAHLNRAHQLLQSHQAVLGPAKDGGTWLLAMRQSAYQRHAFVNVPWLGTQVAQRLAHILGTVAWLPQMHDVDHVQDLHALAQANQLPQGLMRALLLSLAASLRKPYALYGQHLPPLYLPLAPSLRGPPLALA